MYSSTYGISQLYSKFKEYKNISIFCLIILIFTLILYKHSYIFEDKNLKVYFVDVGQGDSGVIVTPNKATIMIDTGNYGEISSKYKSLFKSKQGLGSLVLTHNDSDHVGDADNILKQNEKLKVFGESFVEKLEGQALFSGDGLYTEDGIRLKTLWPERIQGLEDNQKSVVNALEYGEFRFIFTGDIDKSIERRLVAKGYFDKNMIDILKVAHHGSDTSSSEVFLKKIRPEYCVISVGRNNSYKHPSGEVLLRLEKYCGSIYRTDEDGSIMFSTNGKNLIIKKSL